MSPGPAATASTRRTTDDVTCVACGCLCDNLSVTVQGRDVVETQNACERQGPLWFRSGWDASAPRGGGGREVGRGRRGTRACDRDPGRVAVARRLRTGGDGQRDRGGRPGTRGIARHPVRDRPVGRRTGPGRRVSERGSGLRDAGRGEGPHDVVVFWGSDTIPDAPRRLDGARPTAGAVCSRGKGGADARRVGRGDDRDGRGRRSLRSTVAWPPRPVHSRAEHRPEHRLWRNWLSSTRCEAMFVRFLKKHAIAPSPGFRIVY